MRFGLTLMVVGLVAAVCLGLTYSVTRDRIAEQEELREAKACMEAMPGVKEAGELEEDRELEKKAREHIPDVEKIFTCDSGVIIILKVKGYGGPIRMAVGIGEDGAVKGISIISQNETPGLGANVEKEEFLGQFIGKTPADQLKVGESVQGITGATITSKAATKEVREALQAFEEIKGLE
ncbi:MAG: RnfABCDGE type electron transport complex subunit G [Actinobacteria bacterium]|nr:RnfABCDGE type electron transport complex subunit G [Actinomycetota bacterium]MBU4489007.1 RnfABCDGE type electron transport complex subunit G [Actinomycetota bacterium]